MTDVTETSDGDQSLASSLPRPFPFPLQLHSAAGWIPSSVHSTPLVRVAYLDLLLPVLAHPGCGDCSVCKLLPPSCVVLLPAREGTWGERERENQVEGERDLLPLGGPSEESLRPEM